VESESSVSASQEDLESAKAGLDDATATVRLRAVLPNPDGKVLPGMKLLPGMFVRVRLAVGPPHPALLVPESAIGSNQGQKFVYVVNDRSVVEQRLVEVGHTEGDLRVVTGNITAEDWVVTSEVQKLRPGMSVKPEKKDAK
jgi:RND family efflux transporter MFP subunit